MEAIPICPTTRSVLEGMATTWLKVGMVAMESSASPMEGISASRKVLVSGVRTAVSASELDTSNPKTTEGCATNV